MPDIINVHVVVADESRLYFDYLIRNFRHTAKKPERLFFFCYALDKETYARYRDSLEVSACYPIYSRTSSDQPDLSGPTIMRDFGGFDHSVASIGA
jgi:hypothetical protein